MPQVDIGSNSYDSYAELDFANEYLDADVLRAPSWSLLEEDDRSRALVSATRLLQRQLWINGVPEIDTAPEVVQQATALLAADIAAKPALGDSASTASNVKAVGAGSARVEFFSPVAGTVLPSAALALLRGLLGPSTSASSDPALTNTAYGSSDCQRSRFDPTDYGLLGDGYDERLY
jgi:hypothetical protein